MIYRCWTVQCKSEQCGHLIFLDTIGPVQKGKHVLMAPVADFTATCANCNTAHTYRASDLRENDIDDAPMNSISQEFVQALKDGCAASLGTAGFNDGDGTAVSGVFWHTAGFIKDREGRIRSLEPDVPGWYHWFEGLDNFRYLHGPYYSQSEAESNLALGIDADLDDGAGDDDNNDKVIPIAVGQNLQWFGKMVECIENLPPEERAALAIWDQERPEGVGTSEWPGFAQYLPPRPWGRTANK